MCARDRGGVLYGAALFRIIMFSISSKDINDGATADPSLVYDKGGCMGRNGSPQLAWTAPPPGTKSLAITLHDPDAPRKGGWWHWLLFDLPATTNELPAGSGDGTGKLLPKGAIELMNDFGERGYGGPCPPKGHGVHHYHLIVHALKVERLGLPGDATAVEVTRAIAKQELASARMVFLHER